MNSVREALATIIESGVATGIVVMCATPAFPQTSPNTRISVACQRVQEPQTVALADALEQSLQTEPQLIIAQQNELEARADVKSAVSAFLPAAQVGMTGQRYVPNSALSPVVVIGNTVLGGPETKSAYGSLSLTWNLMHSGQDVAAYRGARAAARGASSDLEQQAEDTLTGVLQAYADLYEAQLAVHGAAKALEGLRALQALAEDRFAHGHGTNVAIGQARTAVFQEAETLNEDCRTVTEKSTALAQAIGSQAFSKHELVVESALPLPIVQAGGGADFESIIEESSEVVAAKEKIAAAHAKLQEAERAFGPSVSFSAERDYLGQNVDSLAEAARQLRPNDYWFGLSFQLPVLPLLSEAAAVSKARAEVRKAQAAAQQAHFDIEAKLQKAIALQHEADASYAAAKASFADSVKVLTLTESLYRAGQTDLDSVQHAQMDSDNAETDVQTWASKRAFAAWATVSVLHPSEYLNIVMRQLRLTAPDSEHGG